MDNTIILHGFNECIAGVTVNQRVVYDADKVIDHIVETQGISRTDAIEHFYFNIEGAFLEEKPFDPLFVHLST